MRAARSIAVSLIAAIAGACKERPPPQYVVHIATNDPLIDEFLVISGTDEQIVPRRGDDTSFGLVATHGRSLEPIPLTIAGRKSGARVGPEVKRTIRSFVAREAVDLYVCIDQRCADPLARELYCTEGSLSALEATVSPENLAPFTGWTCFEPDRPRDASIGEDADAGLPEPPMFDASIDAAPELDAEPPPPPDAADSPDRPIPPIPAWAFAFGGNTGDDRIARLAYGPDGGILAAAEYRGAIRFDAATLAEAPDGGQHGAVFGLDDEGRAIWGQAIESTKQITIGGLASSASGVVYIGGTYTDSVKLGTPHLDHSNEGANIFIARFVPSQLPTVELREIHSAADEHLQALLLDETNSRLLIGGSFATSNLQIDTACTLATLGNGQDAFVASLDLNNNLRCQWARVLGSSADDTLKAIAVDPADQSVYVAGEFAGNLLRTGGGGPLMNTGNAVFIQKLDGRGDHVAWTWINGDDGFDEDAVETLVVPSDRGVIVGGKLRPQSRLPSAMLSGGDPPYFVHLRLDLGSAVRAPHATQQIHARAAIATPGNRLLIAGDLSETGTIFAPDGDSQLINVTAGGCNTVEPRDDSLFVALNGDAFATLRVFGGAGEDEPSAILRAPNGDVIIAGTFECTAHFGTATLSAAGAGDGFIYRFTP